MRARVLFILAVLCSVPAFAQGTAAIQGFCDLGGAQAKTSGLNSTNYQQGIIPSCTVTVYLTGTTTKATIYADGNSTPLSNPFTASALGSVAPGQWLFFSALNQGVDIVASGGISPNTYPAPVTLCVDCFPSQSISPVAGVTSITDSAPATGAIIFTGSGVSQSGNTFTFNGGSSLALTTTGTSGTATLIGGTLNIPQYQGALTLTTTGTSGVATLSGGTLNIPNYGAAASGVSSLNSLTGALSITGDSSITVTPSGSSIALHATGTGGNPFPSVGGATEEYPMTDGSGTTVTDVSGHGNNGTFCSGSNAPSWYTYGVAFLDTGTATSPYQCINTPVQSWRTAYFAYCTPTMVQTTGISTGGVPASQFPTFFGGPSGAGVLVLSNNVTASTFNSVMPSIYKLSTGTVLTSLADAYGDCHVYGYSAGASSDIITVDGHQPPNYSANSGSAGSIDIATGDYKIGSGGNLTANGLRGVISYAVIYPTAHTLAQMAQETAYIQYQLSQRPTFPVYPLPTNSRSPQFLAVGDSLTATYEGTAQWTTALTLDNSYVVTNYGIGGITALDACKTAEQRWENSVVSGQTVIHLWVGTNEAQFGFTPAQAWASLASCVTEAHKYGARIIVSTMISRDDVTPAPGSGYSTFDAYKDALNPIIRSLWRAAGFDGLDDIAEVAALGADGAYSNTACFNVDKVHLVGPGAGTCATIGSSNLSGYGIVAALVSASVNTLDGSSSSHPDITTSNAFTETYANNFIIQTPTAAATHTLVDCQGQSTPRTIVNGSATFSITVSAVNSQTINGSATVATGATGVFLPVLTSNSGGGCSWVRIQ